MCIRDRAGGGSGTLRTFQVYTVLGTIRTRIRGVENVISSVTDRVLFSINWDRSSATFGLNSSISSLSVGSANEEEQNIIISARTGGTGYIGSTVQQELIIYDTSQSTKRQQIESNLNTYYGIY